MPPERGHSRAMDARRMAPSWPLVPQALCLLNHAGVQTVDAAWGKVARAVEDGRLGDTAKVSALPPVPELPYLHLHKGPCGAYF